MRCAGCREFPAPSASAPTDRNQRNLGSVAGFGDVAFEFFPRQPNCDLTVILLKYRATSMEAPNLDLSLWATRGYPCDEYMRCGFCFCSHLCFPRRTGQH